MDDPSLPSADEYHDFFDGIYTAAGRNDAAVPWQNAVSRSMVDEWLTGFDASQHTNALVVAAGLGDDAAALAARGLDVTAFDRSPAAVDWAAERHAHHDITWATADLFMPPADWRAGFDLVLEVFTIQSIPPDRQAQAAKAIRSLTAAGGRLVVVALVRSPDSDPSGPPWPLHPATLDAIGVHDDTSRWSTEDHSERELAPDLRIVRRTLRRSDQIAERAR